MNKCNFRSACLAALQQASSLIVSCYKVRVVLALGYIIQLAELLRGIEKTEHRILQQIYHLLQHSFAPHMFFNFKPSLKLTQPSSIVALALASRIGAAISAVSVWKEQLTLLTSVIYEHLPMNMSLSRVRCASRWGAAPMADLLSEADRFFLATYPALRQRIEAARHDIRVAKSLQGFVFKIVRSVLRELDVAAQFIWRLSLWLPSRARDLYSANDIKVLLKPLSKQRTQIRFNILKTLFNFWTTSCRAHEPIPRACLFGCTGATEELSLVCHFGGALASCSGIP
jgi:hypothetical protein